MRVNRGRAHPSRPPCFGLRTAMNSISTRPPCWLKWSSPSPFSSAPIAVPRATVAGRIRVRDARVRSAVIATSIQQVGGELGQGGHGGGLEGGAIHGSIPREAGPPVGRFAWPCRVAGGQGDLQIAAALEHGAAEEPQFQPNDIEGA